MDAYSVAEAKAHLSAIIEAVERGEEVVITKRGKPVARMLRESADRGAIDWPKIDAFREKLKKGKASVLALRKQARY
jgi:antitoxin (DNA-binding transcriptional repressor) of toxin-antitoxin stability system